MAEKKRADGDGAIYYNAARGRWEGQVTLGWRDGKRFRRKLTGQTKGQVAKKIRDLRNAHTNGMVPMNRTMTVQAWMTYWLKEIAAEYLEETSFKSYEDKTNGYIIPLLGHHRLDRLTPEHIEAAWKHLRTVGNPKLENPKPLSAGTVLQAHAILARALKVAAQRGHLARNPAASQAMDPPTHKPPEVEPMTTEEARQLLAAADKADRNGARWVVALSLGLRQAEALGLTWEHVDLKNAVIHVRQSCTRLRGKGLVVRGLKTKSSRRDIAIPPPLVAMLKAHRLTQNKERLKAGDWYDDRGFVFAQPDGKPIDPSTDSRAWGRLLKAAGLPHYRLHDARHTAATLLLLEGVDIRVAMQILGHSRPEMTVHYQHVVDDMRRDAAAKMGNALWG